MPPYKPSFQWYGCMAPPDRRGAAHLAQYPVRGIPEDADLLKTGAWPTSHLYRMPSDIWPETTAPRTDWWK